MNTPRRSIRLTDEQVAALEELARHLNITGQRGATLNPLIAWIADNAERLTPPLEKARQK